MFKAKLTKDTGETVTITLPQDYLPLSEEVASYAYGRSIFL